jgi:hypothetical protein
MPVTDALDLLLRTRDGAGGWGWMPGGPANTECTALAVLACRSAAEPAPAATAAAEAGTAWLHSHQRHDGSWPLNGEVEGSSWMTSVAVYALSGGTAADAAAAVRGAEWLVGQRSRGRSTALKVVQRLLRSRPAVDQDPDLAGWPWTADTSAWVEPTAWAMLALKRLRGRPGAAQAEERIAEAERLLIDRMCNGGGWNYGNRAVRGYELVPFPDTTALALVALQDRRSADVTGASIVRLKELLAGYRSVLVLALSSHALAVHGHGTQALRTELAARLRTGEHTDVRALALGVMAMNEAHLHLGPARA